MVHFGQLPGPKKLVQLCAERTRALATQVPGHRVEDTATPPLLTHRKREPVGWHCPGNPGAPDLTESGRICPLVDALAEIPCSSPKISSVHHQKKTLGLDQASSSNHFCTWFHQSMYIKLDLASLRAFKNPTRKACKTGTADVSRGWW